MRSEWARATTCSPFADELTAAVEHGGAGAAAMTLSPDASGHVAQCLRCQAEVAQYRRLGRELAAVATRRPAVPAGLEYDILAMLDAEDERHFPWAAAAVGGLAAAAGVLALATRGVHRQRRLAG